MLISAALAGGGAFYYAKASIEENDFNRSIQLIAQDNDAGWCKIANASIVQDNQGTHYCAVAMQNFVEAESDQ